MACWVLNYNRCRVSLFTSTSEFRGHNTYNFATHETQKKNSVSSSQIVIQAMQKPLPIKSKGGSELEFDPIAT